MYDRASHYSDQFSEFAPTTHDQAVDFVAQYLAGCDAEILEDYEDDLQRDEEYRLAAWMREFRHERETVDEERLRYEREDKQADELEIGRAHV